MKRAYYNSHNGMITLVVPERVAPRNNGSYILIADSQSVNEYKVNLSTLTLEPLPEDQIAKRTTR